MHRLVRYTERLSLRWHAQLPTLLRKANCPLGDSAVVKRHGHSNTGPGGLSLSELPKHARVVICGGGIIGTSVAYHLTLLGWSDVVLLEQGRYDADNAFSDFQK